MNAIGHVRIKPFGEIRSPKKADKLAAKVEKLRKDITAQKRALEKANNQLKVLHISERKWSWIGTTVGVLAFATPFVKEISDLVDLNTNDSGCQNSQASIGVGIAASTLAICFICVKTINNCITKKKDRLIAPLEKQLEEMIALEKIFDIMETFSTEQDEQKEELLIECTRKMKKHQGIYLTDETKQKWFYLLSQKLPENSEVKQLVSQAQIITDADASELKSSSYSSNSAKASHSASSSEDIQMRLSYPSRSISSSNPEDSSSAPSSIHPQTSDWSLSPPHSTTSSPFLSEDDADNQAAQVSPLSSGSNLVLDENRKTQLEKITMKLNEKFGYKQFSEGKIVFG